MSRDELNKLSQGSTGQGFGLGLLIGGLAGVSAYYLFGTEQGNKLKKKLVEEFEYAQVRIPHDIAEILHEAEVRQATAITNQALDSAQERMGLLAKLTGKEKKKILHDEYIQENTGVKKKPRNLFYKSGRKIS